MTVPLFFRNCRGSFNGREIYRVSIGEIKLCSQASRAGKPKQAEDYMIEPKVTILSLGSNRS
jgi:hypothetical protein